MSLFRKHNEAQMVVASTLGSIVALLVLGAIGFIVNWF